MEYFHVVEIILEVEAITLTLALCRDAILGLTCYTEYFERTLILIGALAIVWLFGRMLRNVFSKSKPH